MSRMNDLSMKLDALKKGSWEQKFTDEELDIIRKGNLLNALGGVPPQETAAATDREREAKAIIRMCLISAIAFSLGVLVTWLAIT